MTYTLTVELQANLTQDALRARVLSALMRLEDRDAEGPGVLVGHWHLDTTGEQGISTKDAIRERRARAARLVAACGDEVTAANLHDSDCNCGAHAAPHPFSTHVHRDSNPERS